MPKEQRNELRVWDEKQREKGVTFGKNDKKEKQDSKAERSAGGMSKKDISALVSKEIDNHTDKLSQRDEDEEIDALISALATDSNHEAPSSPTMKVQISEPKSVVNTSALCSIIRRVKNPPNNGTKN